MAERHETSIETPYGWLIAIVSLAIMAIGFGVPYVVVVALKPIAAEFGWPRSWPGLGNSCVYVGAGVGGIFMGWLTDRIGVMWPAIIGSLMIGVGAILVSTSQGIGQFLFAHALFIGLLGNSTTFTPLMTNV